MYDISIPLTPDNLSLKDILFITDTVLICLRKNPENGKFAQPGFLESVCAQCPLVEINYREKLNALESFSIPLQIGENNGIDISPREWSISLGMSSLPLTEECASTIGYLIEDYFSINR